jgi:hypothetical protein
VCYRHVWFCTGSLLVHVCVYKCIYNDKVNIFKLTVMWELACWMARLQFFKLRTMRTLESTVRERSCIVTVLWNMWCIFTIAKCVAKCRLRKCLSLVNYLLKLQLSSQNMLSSAVQHNVLSYVYLSSDMPFWVPEMINVLLCRFWLCRDSYE